MPPAMMQLQSTGDDIHLTKDPQINIFKYTYYRYVNFATEISRFSLNELATFNKKTSCLVPKQGHLLSKLYLHIKLPALTKTSGTYLCWSDALGYAIFNGPIELEIGGTVVDRIYPRFLDLWEDFSNADKSMGKNFMLLRSDITRSMIRNATKEVDLVIPLDFWFTKNYSMALPLMSMTNQEIRLYFRFRDFAEVINYDGADPEPVEILDSNLFAEYIFLDSEMENMYKNTTHKYLIEQTQYNGQEIIPANVSLYTSRLKFNNYVKEIFFCAAEKQNVDNNNYFAYSFTSNNDNPLITHATLYLDGKKRFEDYLPEFYYRSVFPDCVHSVIPMKHVYCMPFSLKPQDNQPTGAINLSAFSDIILSLKIANNNPELYLYSYALSYNVVTVGQGIFSMETILM